MATLPMQTNSTNDWKEFTGSSDFSGTACNVGQAPLYCFIAASGGSVSEKIGFPLTSFEKFPVSIAAGESLYFKAMTEGMTAKILLG